MLKKSKNSRKNIIKNFVRLIAICFISTTAILATSLERDSCCGPITIEDHYSSGSHIHNRIKDLFGTVFSDLQIMPNLGLFNRFPYLSVAETDRTVVVKVELPGLDENEIKVDTSGNHLIISGDKKEEKNKDKSTCHICELAYGKFSRNIALPFEIEAQNINASFDKGVLTITIQKPEVKKINSQNIPINSKKKT